MKRKQNPFQRFRQINIDLVKKTVARAMPLGVVESRLIAGLQVSIGVTERKAKEYILVLQEAGLIEYDSEVSKWKMAGYQTPAPTEKETGQKSE